VGVQITAHQVDSSAKASSNEWIQMKSNVIDKTEHAAAWDKNAQAAQATAHYTFERSLLIH
jgi:hypothetical protein